MIYGGIYREDRRIDISMLYIDRYIDILIYVCIDRGIDILIDRCIDLCKDRCYILIYRCIDICYI